MFFFFTLWHGFRRALDHSRALGPVTLVTWLTSLGAGASREHLSRRLVLLVAPASPRSASQRLDVDAVGGEPLGGVLRLALGLVVEEVVRQRAPKHIGKARLSWTCPIPEGASLSN